MLGEVVQHGTHEARDSRCEEGAANGLAQGGEVDVSSPPATVVCWGLVVVIVVVSGIVVSVSGGVVGVAFCTRVLLVALLCPGATIIVDDIGADVDLQNVGLFLFLHFALFVVLPVSPPSSALPSAIPTFQFDSFGSQNILL